MPRASFEFSEICYAFTASTLDSRLIWFVLMQEFFVVTCRRGSLSRVIIPGNGRAVFCGSWCLFYLICFHVFRNCFGLCLHGNCGDSLPRRILLTFRRAVRCDPLTLFGVSGFRPVWFMLAFVTLRRFLLVCIFHPHVNGPDPH